MRVASKVASGSGLLLLLFAGAMIYQLLLVRDLARAHRDLATLKTRAAKIALDEIRRLEEMEEFARKLYVTRDLEYAAKIDQLRDDSASALVELESLALSNEEGVAAGRLVEAWRRLPPTPQASSEALSQVAPLRRLRARTEALLSAVETAIDVQSRSSLSASHAARRFAIAVVVTALVLSVLVVRLTVRSIQEPLHRLTVGTRAVADGEFDVRLDTSRGDEFAELALDFNAMAQRLGELDEVKKDLLSHVSHELKTPLATLQETHQVLLEEIPGQLNAQQRRLLELNLKSSERLSRLISKLLDLSRHEAGVVTYDFATRDLRQLVDDVVSELEPRAREHQIRLESQYPEQPLELRCDGDRLMQVLENLVENAIKFAPAETVVEVCVELDQTSGFLVAVSDCGPGVPEGEKKKIFDKFHQAGPRRGGSVGGAGLGLAICRGIVEAHQGELWVSDRSPLGSTFWVRLPELQNET